MKIGCLITQISLPENYHSFMDGLDQSRYDSLAKCALNSFKKFHPKIDIHYVNDTNFYEYYEQGFDTFPLVNNIGIVKFIIAYDLMIKKGYNKIIILGCDTITCSPLDEFLNDSTDVLATLNYPCQESTEYWVTPIIETFNGNHEHANINADVVCFNNPDALKKVIELSLIHDTHFSEQGGLNELAWVDKSYPVKIVDFPYSTSQVVYNARSKGVFGTDMIHKGLLIKHGHLDGQPSPVRKFYVKDKKLYTQDHKQIKVWHYVEGLGGRSDEQFYELLNDFKTNWFNQETLQFFREECGCNEFFN
jgi:hypothetical protein